MPKVSLIVPCYNAANFLSATIESVLKQEFVFWELILVDDGSRDSTWDIVSRYVQLDSRITGFQMTNGGTSKARNFGFSKSSPSSNYIFFLDHDDQLEPNALKEMSAYLDLQPDVGLVGCQFQDVSADGQRLGTGKRSRWAPGRIFPHELKDGEYETPFATFFCATGQGPFALYRRSVYVQTDGWETGFWPHEDTDMFCQMALLSKVHFLPDRLYLKRIHPAQGMSDGARVQRSYGAFRAKWDNRKPKNAREATLLKGAKKYYYSIHRPCRDLKVSRMAFLEFCSHPSFRKLKWCMQLVVSVLRGFLFARFSK
jgi:glycosyltransferase involved in cell wall biosynthesis